MARLTEEMVIARSKQSDLSSVKKLNCWGAGLGDVSLLRRMPNVEVLAFSINKIRSLEDFGACRRLRELYIRNNDIRELSEIRHLRHLPDLTNLWLDENPCTRHPRYRMTVLKNLPNLEKLDNVVVHQDEVQEAAHRGDHIPDSDDEGYHQESYQQQRRRCDAQRSCESSPERELAPCYQKRASALRPQRAGSDSSEGAEPPPSPPPADRNRAADPPPPQYSGGDSPPPSRRAPPVGFSGPAAAAAGRRSSDCDERYEHPAMMTRSHYETRCGPRSPDAAFLPRSFSAHSVKDYSYSTNGDCRYSGGGGGSGGGSSAGGGSGGGGVVSSPPHNYHEPYYDRVETAAMVRGECEQDRVAGGTAARERDREYPSAVMAEHRGFTRRPVTRNSNLLSAVLCLVKELDYPSLEVAEMAVRCRMDELANGP